MKIVGVFAIGLGLILIVIGITGTQSQVLADIKSISPTIRNATNTQTGAGEAGLSGGAGIGTVTNNVSTA